MSATERGRDALLAWQASKPDNFFDSDPNLSRALAYRLGADRYASARQRLEGIGAMAATELAPLAIETNLDENLPRLERYDALGQRTEEVVFHPSYHAAGRLVWQTGILSDYAWPGNETLQMGVLYLLSQSGEHGHNCPLACTAGLIKLLARVASPEQQAKWLPGLLTREYDARLHASQFLTEVQGGSDVGSNAVIARQSSDGWRLFGEKWFCSVIDAKLFLMTARPEGAAGGTRGLGLFVVPRSIEGRTNEFFVRRLKRKLGTRAMASAEVDFAGAFAEPIGDVTRGFKNVVEHVLNTSRIFNAICCAGSMFGAYREAATYARHRHAFGQPIAEYPLVQEALASLRAESMAALASSLRLSAQSDTLAKQNDESDESRALAWRLGVNVNKYWTSVRNTQMVRLAMEVLGGNGAIESFSPLVRLYRDAMVLESWEGTHNVLVQQVMRDSERFGSHRAFMAELDHALGVLGLPETDSALIERAQQGLRTLERGFSCLTENPADQRLGRRVTNQAAVLLQLVALLEELADFPADAAKRAAVEWMIDQHLAVDLAASKPLSPALA